MINKLTSSHLLALSILILTVLAFVGSRWLWSTFAAFQVAALICSVLVLLRPLLMPAAGATKVRIASLIGIFAIASTHSFGADLFNTAVKALAASPEMLRLAPWLAEVEWSTEPSIPILIFADLGVLIVNYFMTEKTIGGTPETPIRSEFKERSFRQQRDAFCGMLAQHLHVTDIQSNWSPEYYTELEAEVEVASSKRIGAPKRIINLQKALRSERDVQAFLVLGDPGGGKSVALRKLARDMLAEVDATSRIPVYINLREWLPMEGRRHPWTEQSPPTHEELMAFVIDSIKSRGNHFQRKFVDQYFHDLWAHGYLFFIFDSFDEIPELLDVHEESWLIEQLSQLLSQFIYADGEKSRGILASRPFRRPTESFLAQKTLEIRPMSELRIKTALARYPGFTETLQTQLLRERPDWLPIVRNPFMMALLGEWVSTNDTLPQTQADLYRHYLQQRLRDVEPRIRKYGLTPEQVLSSATQIAGFVFYKANYGLEAPVSVLKNESSIEHGAETIEILSDALIARVTSGDITSFAFVHRRFLEYLVTTRMLAQTDAPPIMDIPTDARGRDAMVLYAQLCDDDTAQGLGQFCWREIDTHFRENGDTLRAIHCLRFLTDAFRSRRQALAPFAADLSTFVTAYAERADNLLQAQICLEATGLLDNSAAIAVLQSAMSRPNNWLRETAFRACRHLPSLSGALQQRINDYLIKMPALQFWRERDALFLSLALSDPLRGAYRIAVWRERSLIAAITTMALGSLLAPPIALFLATMACMLILVDMLTIPLVTYLTPKQRRKSRQPVSLLPEGTLFRLYQNFFAGILLWMGIWMWARHPDAKAMTALLPVLRLLTPQQQPGLVALVLILGLLSMDWLLLRYLGRAYLDFMALSWQKKIKFLLVMTVSLLIVPAVVGLTAWIAPRIPAALQDTAIAILAAGLGILLGFAAIRGSWDYLHDRLTLRRIMPGLGWRMSRQQIVNVVGALKLPRHRLAVVKKIADMKTVAVGEWPSGFKFTLDSDAAMTELAKLERRWLKLDR